MTDNPDIPNESMEALERQLALDLMPCSMGPKAIAELGLLPASPEGQDIEHIMSHVRMNKITPLMPSIHAYAIMIAEIWVKLFLAGAPEGLVPEEAKAGMMESQIARLTEAISTTLANMYDAGFISFGEFFKDKNE